MIGYKTEITEEEKEQIIEDFLPFIKYTASRLAWRIPPQMTMDDLISAGTMGILYAFEKFKKGRVKFKTYAKFRVKGTMLDELRAVDWMPRSVKKKINKVKKAHAMLEKELGRMPEDEEVAKSLELSLDEYYKTLQDANGSISFRFEDFEANDSSDDRPNILESIPDPNAKSPLNILENTVQRKIVAKFINELSKKERVLLSLYYWEDLTMKEVGKVMKLTEGRICQLRTQALSRLKAKMDSHFNSGNL